MLFEEPTTQAYFLLTRVLPHFTGGREADLEGVAFEEQMILLPVRNLAKRLGWWRP